jgi:hypothetical protein
LNRQNRDLGTEDNLEIKFLVVLQKMDQRISAFTFMGYMKTLHWVFVNSRINSFVFQKNIIKKKKKETSLFLAIILVLFEQF